jgi:hypothetical protein
MTEAFKRIELRQATEADLEFLCGDAQLGRLLSLDANRSS